MTPAIALANAIDPALRLVAQVGGPQPSDAARRFLLAVALQESGLTARYQGAPDAPLAARSFWQFEIGGVQGVLFHGSTARFAADICRACDTVPTAPDVWRAIEGHDMLAASLARLLLWTDTHPLPDSEDAAWSAYERCWRPGAPSRTRWATSWATALQHAPQGPLQAVQAPGKGSGGNVLAEVVSEPPEPGTGPVA